MTDRQPTRPGRVSLTDEQTNVTKYYTMEMADEPTNEGTPPTKSNLFSDATAAKYPAGTETVDGALSAIPGMIAGVGDIKTTVRTDLGDKWLLCNGDEVSEAAYPDLYALLNPSAFANEWKAETEVVAGKWKQLGNYWVRLDGNSFYYASNPTQTGTMITPYTATVRTIVDAVFTGTYYVFLHRSSDSGYWNLCYSTSISGPWSNFALPFESGYTASCSNLLVDDVGRLIFLHTNNRSDVTTLYQGTNPESLNTSTSTTVPKGGGRIAYGNGYYVVSVTSGTSSYRGIRYTTDVTQPLSNWTKNTSKFALIDFANGYFVSQDGRMYGTTPENLTGSNNTGTYETGVSYANGKFYHFSNSGTTVYVNYKTSLTDATWEQNAVGTTTSSLNNATYTFVYGDKICVNLYGGGFVSNVPAKYLPMISNQGEGVQGTFSYIKALEGC